jgi:WD40 repeat protein
VLPEDYRIADSDFNTFAISPDERWAVLQMLNSQTLVVWDLVNQRIKEAPSMGGKSRMLKYGIEFSPDGKYLAMGGPGIFQIYRSGTFELYFEKLDPSGWLGGYFGFSADSGQVIYGLNPATIHMLSANQPLVVPAVPQGRSGFSRTSKDLFHGFISDSDNLTIKRWPRVSREFVELIGHERSVKGITFHPSEPWVLTSSMDDTVRFWNLDDGAEIQRINTPKAASSEDPVFSPDGRILVTALEDEVGTVQIRDARTTQIIHEFELGARTYFVDFSNDGNLLAISGIGIVKAWKYEKSLPLGAPGSIQLTKIMELNDPALGGLTTVRFSRDSRYMAWFEASPDLWPGRKPGSPGIRVWDLETNRALPHVIETFNPWNSFDFIGRDHLMAIAAPEGGIELWNFVTGEKVSQLAGHDGNSEQIDVSNDGRYVAFFDRTGGGFGLFDLKANELLFMSPPLSAPAWHINWNQDGTLLGITEENGQARVLKINAIREQLAELGLDWDE